MSYVPETGSFSRKSSANSTVTGSPSKRPSRRQSIDLMKRIALAEARRQTKADETTKNKLDLFEQLLNLNMADGTPQTTETTTARPQSCPAKPQPNDNIEEKGAKGKKKSGTANKKVEKVDKVKVGKQIIEDELKHLPTIRENVELINSAPASLSSYSRNHTGTLVTTPNHKFKNLCEGYYRHDHADYVLSIAADRLAGTPFQNFLFQRKYTSYDWQIMNLWHTIQVLK